MEIVFEQYSQRCIFRTFSLVFWKNLPIYEHRHIIVSHFTNTWSWAPKFHTEWDHIWGLDVFTLDRHSELPNPSGRASRPAYIDQNLSLNILQSEGWACIRQGAPKLLSFHEFSSPVAQILHRLGSGIKLECSWSKFRPSPPGHPENQPSRVASRSKFELKSPKMKNPQMIRTMILMHPRPYGNYSGSMVALSEDKSYIV